MTECFKCLYRMEHPFHDNGTINEDCDMTPFTAPTHASGRQPTPQDGTVDTPHNK